MDEKSVTLEVSKPLKSTAFKDWQFENIERMLATPEVSHPLTSASSSPAQFSNAPSSPVTLPVSHMPMSSAFRELQPAARYRIAVTLEVSRSSPKVRLSIACSPLNSPSLSSGNLTPEPTWMEAIALLSE